MERFAAMFAMFLVACAVARPCSLESFTKPESAGPNFTVTITHRDRPISGISVTLTPENHEPIQVGVSDEKGRVEIHGLSIGRYWLRAKYDEIETETRWVEVGNKRNKQKAHFELHWADYSIGIRDVSGVLTGLVPGNTGNKLMDLVHAKEVAHSGVALSLKNAFVDNQYSTISDSTGSFMFGPVPPGTYLLSIAGGRAVIGGLVAQETVLVLDVSPSSQLESLALRLTQGGCGGIEYELKNN